MILVKTKKNHAISERSTPDKVHDCRTNPNPPPRGRSRGHGSNGEEVRLVVEQAKQVRVEEVGTEGTASNRL
jgi:hypothetical protein